MNKKGTNKNTFLAYILITLVIICSIFRYKSIFIEPNSILEVSVSSLLYPFTFLIIMLINKKSNFNNTHKIIIKTTLIFILFNLLISILNTIPGNYYSREIDTALKEVLTPDYFLIKKIPIYYPDIINLLSFSLLFYFSHILLIILYEAMEPYTNKFVAFALSMFIPFTLDTLCFVTITNTFNLIDFSKMINNLTSNFVIVILFTLLITIIYTIKQKIDESK